MAVRKPIVLLDVNLIGELPAGDTISSTSSGGVLPVVTGEVPPVLVYFDDGSLLYAPAEY